LADVEEYKRWIGQAERTFELIDADIEYGGYSWACFRAQQAAEFAVKALLYLFGIPAFGHEISKLLKN
jgi:HEPN domain-containing protein